MIARVVLIALSLASAPGCALLIRGSHQPVQFTSDPAGAQVEIARGKPAWCRTPCTIDVPRSSSPRSYSARLGGREPLEAELIPAEETDAIWIPVALFDGLLVLPGIVDLMSQTFYDYPTEVRITLPPEGQGGARVSVTRDEPKAPRR